MGKCVTTTALFCLLLYSHMYKIQEEALKSKLPEAILRRERNKAAASLDERIVMAAEEHKRAQELLKEEVGAVQ